MHIDTCMCLVCLLSNMHASIVAAQQEVYLNTSSLIRGSLALPQQQVVFTCKTKGSTILEWHSNEYIGTGGDSIPVYSVGTRDNVTSGGNPNTYATRVNVTIEDEIIVIVSQLFIVATEQFLTSTITCRINGNGPSESITFNTTATALQEVSLNNTLIRGRYALPQQSVNFTCKAKNSTILEWHSDEYIGTGGDSIPIYSVGSRDRVTSGGNPNTYATRVSVAIEDGITIIVSQLFIIASEQFPTSTVTCQINGNGPSKSSTFNTTATALQNVMLNGTLVRGFVAYSQQRVIFTCISKNSTILEWQSDDYIGIGGDIIPIYSVGTRDNVTSGGNPNTYATRISVGNEDGITVIVSQLHILASVPCSVTCRISSQGASGTITFNVTGDQPPAPKLNSTLREGLRACPGQTYYFECVVEVSYSLIWMSDEYIGRDGYSLEISSKDGRDIPKSGTENSDTVASLKEITTRDRTLELISSLRVQVSLSIVHHNHTVTCLNPATGMNRSVEFLMADDCDEITTSGDTTVPVAVEEDNSFNRPTA